MPTPFALTVPLDPPEINCPWLALRALLDDNAIADGLDSDYKGQDRECRQECPELRAGRQIESRKLSLWNADPSRIEHELNVVHPEQHCHHAARPDADERRPQPPRS